MSDYLTCYTFVTLLTNSLREQCGLNLKKTTTNENSKEKKRRKAFCLQDKQFCNLQKVSSLPVARKNCNVYQDLKLDYYHFIWSFLSMILDLYVIRAHADRGRIAVAEGAFKMLSTRPRHRIDQPEVQLSVGTFEVGVLAHVASRISSSPSIRHPG